MYPDHHAGAQAAMQHLVPGGEVRQTTDRPYSTTAIPSSESDAFNWDLDIPDGSPPLWLTSQPSTFPSYPARPPLHPTPLSLDSWSSSSSAFTSPLNLPSSSQSLLQNDSYAKFPRPGSNSIDFAPFGANPAPTRSAHSQPSSESASAYSSDHSTWNSRPASSSQHRPALTTGSQGCAVSESQDWSLPLHIAAERGHESIVRALIDGAVDINERDSNGCTALHVGVKWKQEGVVKVLLESGADVNALDNAGWTPVHSAADNGFAAGLRLLLDFGGNLTLKARKKSQVDQG
ncbi:ankyrin repeat domain-containing protein [Aspergillus puulaauensis]|uniref:Ankyrin repeat-containing domain protein n=1 Tax=Aspergillus puulaauensis TaxID=1220207 RepID=A0A7R7XW20_9EURO|nr:uncharacterized protein APUU_61041A [Aspergillus puulaauensis]BCS27993.1 hypothetical protein APUU_61041A [Aspergillus puulaauensis]